MADKHQITISDGQETDTFEATTEELAASLFDAESSWLCEERSRKHTY